MGAGYWISIQSLEPEAQPVIDALKAAAEKVRASKFAVLDLRGNGGGNDLYGRTLAEALYGSAYVDSTLGPVAGSSGTCNSVFRASLGNIEAIGKLGEKFSHDGDVAGAREYGDAVVVMKRALAKHEALTGSAHCAKLADAPVATSVVSLMQARDRADGPAVLQLLHQRRGILSPARRPAGGPGHGLRHPLFRSARNRAALRSLHVFDARRDHARRAA